ncbi:HEAT repeat domain-containing protein [Pseudanabaena sp. PCC 6802]|uniref:HEAT repeat domain-containing protein n=1 Tax=Pseudanabaena sp. PCC 6802 TaxID=118173 RepID=UPI00034961C4|nr:HEAT repeat domain-containing protein [Pseudanabaena sp. PCC 6802]
MSGLEILLLLVGAVVGAGLMFWWQEDRIKQLKIDHKRALRKVIETTERQNFASRSSSSSNTVDRLTPPPIADKGLSPTIMQAATESAIAPTEQFVPASRSPEVSSEPVIEPVIEPTMDETIVNETTIDEAIFNEAIVDEAIIEPLTEPTSDEAIVNETIDEPLTEPVVEPIGKPEIASASTESIGLSEVPPAPAQITEPSLPLPTQIQAEPPLVTQIFDEPPIAPDWVAASTQQQLATVPNQPFRQPLKDKIAAWGQVASPTYIPQLLPYVNHPSPNVRADVAKALGQIAAIHNLHAYEPQVIPVLEQLSRDRHLEIRYQAIVALGHLKSDRAIPILTAALHDPSSKLVKAASSALARLKYYALPSAPQTIKPPKRVIYKKPIRFV